MIVKSDFILNSQTLTPSLTWDTTDCDKDGFDNGTEIINNTNPLDPCDPISCIDTLFIPQVFTPNSDGKNDVFEILGLSKYPNNTIIIYKIKAYVANYTYSCVKFLHNE